MMPDSKLSPYQLDQLKEKYASMIIDGMDIDTLCQFAHEQILISVHNYNQDEIFDEVERIYDEETLKELIEDVEPNISELELNTPDYGVGK